MEDQKDPVPHDEAFKKLLQTFFREFIELFFPELDKLLDYRDAKFLMQELLVDVVGESARTLDLLFETRYKAEDAVVLIHLEPNAYREPAFAERMYIYYSRLYERHRHSHRFIIPIAVIAADDGWDAPDEFVISFPLGEIIRFRYFKLNLRKLNWRKFIDSGNPVAAALLAKMGYNRGERRELRTAYLRMLFRLKDKQNDAKMALIMSVADLYFKPIEEEDRSILKEFRDNREMEEEAIMELMPAWKRWGLEEGLQKGREEGRVEGRVEGRKEGQEQGVVLGRDEERRTIALRMLGRGIKPEEIADLLQVPEEQVRRWSGT